MRYTRRWRGAKRADRSLNSPICFQPVVERVAGEVANAVLHALGIMTNRLFIHAESAEKCFEDCPSACDSDGHLRSRVGQNDLAVVTMGNEAQGGQALDHAGDARVRNTQGPGQIDSAHGMSGVR
jgi:hypothetical protein